MSKHIFVIGAGRSATDLISYLLQAATENDWYITVGDMSVALAEEKVQGHTRGKAIYFDGANADMRQEHIAQADIVVSLLPPPHAPADCTGMFTIWETFGYSFLYFGRDGKF